MKLRAIALFAALLWASSAHATTVTGTMKDVQGTLLSGAGDYATFQLMNFGSNVPRVTGTNIVVQTQPLRVTSAQLVIGVTIQANDTITPATTFYRVTFFHSGQLFRSFDHRITGASYNLDSVTPITTAPVVAPPTGGTTYLRLDGGNINLGGNLNLVTDYRASAGTGLTLNLAAGTAFCGNPPANVEYAGGALTMTNAATNYVYLDPTASCVPAKNTTGFTTGMIPVAQVVAAGGVITGVTDVRTWFVDLTSMGAGNWSSLTNPTGGLTLSMGAHPTGFEYTTQNDAWEWRNTTPATSTVSYGSPQLGLQGHYWTGVYSAPDSWFVQGNIGSGTNGASTLTINHVGSSGTASVSVPGLILGTPLGLAYGGWGSSNGSFQGTITSYVPDSNTRNFQGWRTGDAHPSVVLTRRALILGNGTISPHMQFYHPSTGFVRLRNYSTDPTEGEALVFAIDANPTVGKEATLVLHVGVEADGQYLDFFNNTGYTNKRYGIRIQKRGTGSYYPFTFGFYDGTTETESFRVLISPLGSVQFAQPVQVLGVAEYADNAAAVAAELAVGTLYRTGDALKIVH